jgi:hypothetical protein
MKVGPRKTRHHDVPLVLTRAHFKLSEASNEQRLQMSLGVWAPCLPPSGRQAG